MGFKFKPPPPRKCECRIVGLGANSADPDRSKRCSEIGLRFIETVQGKVYVCPEHFNSHMIASNGQAVQVFSRITPRR
jgi:hypothetical protein